MFKPRSHYQHLIYHKSVHYSCPSEFIEYALTLYEFKYKWCWWHDSFDVIYTRLTIPKELWEKEDYYTHKTIDIL